MQITGIRSSYGMSLIRGAIDTFHAIAERLDDGIKNCQEDINARQKVIESHEEAIDDIKTEINRAMRVKQAMRDLLGVEA